jgi:hypothetical protein
VTCCSQLAASWKCLTRSEFNHVAVVVETPRGIKFLLEAVAPKSLAWKLTDAMTFWHSDKANASSIVYRPLLVLARSLSCCCNLWCQGVRRGVPLTRAVFNFAVQMQVLLLCCADAMLTAVLVQGRPYEDCWVRVAL